MGLSMSSQTVIFDAEINDVNNLDPYGEPKEDVYLTSSGIAQPIQPIFEKVTNPQKTGINTSDNCYRYVKSEGQFNWLMARGTFINAASSTEAAPQTVTTGFSILVNKFATMKLMSPIDATYIIKLQYQAGIYDLKETISLTANTWTELIFDLSANNGDVTGNQNGGWISDVRITLNPADNGAGEELFIDDFTVSEPFYETVADGDYGTTTNWFPDSVPTQTGDEIDVKHNMTYTGNLSLKKLLVRVKQSLEVTGDLTVANQSNVLGGGTLTATGTATGTFSVFRAIDEVAVSDLDGWHLVSSPVSGEQYNDAWISSFGIATSTTDSNRKGIGTYNNNTLLGSFTYATAPVADTDFDEGKGYIMKADTGGSVVQFIGNLRTSNITDIALTKDANAFNLVGNPFSGYISVTNLMAANDAGGNDLLTESTIWVWNSNTKGYEAKTGAYLIAPGQGFFVEATAAAATFTFNTSMLEALPSAGTDNFTSLKSGATPSIKLNITDGDLTRYAKVSYLDTATNGFDNGFDGKLFGGVAQPFAVYTHLLNDNNGTKYQLQSLPNNDFESMVVPVGVNAAAGKEITFSAEALNLPSGLKVYLEDRENNTFTHLDGANSDLKVTLTEALNGTGRFYLHTRSSALSVSDDALLGSVSIFKSAASTLRITGLSQGKATVKLYNTLGKKVTETSFNTNGVQDISLPKLATGIYIVQLETETGKLNKKITLE
jgi:hypothetical protein